MWPRTWCLLPTEGAGPPSCLSCLTDCDAHHIDHHGVWPLHSQCPFSQNHYFQGEGLYPGNFTPKPTATSVGLHNCSTHIWGLEIIKPAPNALVITSIDIVHPTSQTTSHKRITLKITQGQLFSSFTGDKKPHAVKVLGEAKDEKGNVFTLFLRFHQQLYAYKEEVATEVI